MKWYEGDIAQAVMMSKRKNAVFVVYVEGKDDISTKLTSQINESNVTTQLESETFVAIKIEAGTVTHNQFAAIYKNVPVPSLFFIGKNGNPIDTILDSSNATDLQQRINKVIEAHTGVAVVAETTSNSNSSAAALELSIDSESAPVDSNPVDSNPVDSNLMDSNPGNVNKNISGIDLSMESASGSQLNNIPGDLSYGSVSASSNPDITETTNFLEEELKISQEEKIQRAKELLEKTRELKKHEEEAAEKLKEIERRKMGKDVQEMRRRQQDQELKNLMEERQRTKNEEKAARDRILAQIASDKADRAARFGTSPPQAVANAAEPVNVVRHLPVFNQNMAHIQFRLPDGTTNTHEFDSSDTLQVVRNYITLNLKPPFKQFSLSTTFPRREFTEDDNAETLKDLELCPTAVILILPANAANTVSANTPGGLMTLVWFFLTPIIGIFDYFRSFFVRPRNDASTRNAGNRRRASDAADSNNVPPMKRKATEATTVRRQGNSNIHLLRDKKDSDDENNTWNGNSTQQM